MEIWKKTVLTLVICAIVLSGCVRPVTEPTTEPAAEPTTAPTAEPASESIPMEDLVCVVQIHNILAGINYGLGLPHYEYYAIRDSGVEIIDEETAGAFDRRLVDSDLRESGNRFGNEGTKRWFAQLMYAPRVENYDSERYMYRNHYWLPTEFEDNVRIYYSYRGPAEEKAEPEIEQVMLQAAHTFFTEDLEKYRAGNELAWQLTCFMVTVNGDTVFIEDRDNNLYRPMPDGSLQLLIEMPNTYSRVSYYWFPKN